MKLWIVVAFVVLGSAWCAPQLDRFDRYNGLSNNIGYNNNGRRNQRIKGLPTHDPYQPQKAEEIPIEIGERRCDNTYNGSILPCLLRPGLPPFSYSTTEGYNMEYKK